MMLKYLRIAQRQRKKQTEVTEMHFMVVANSIPTINYNSLQGILVYLNIALAFMQAK